jgi:hypothetical protein
MRDVIIVSFVIVSKYYSSLQDFYSNHYMDALVSDMLILRFSYAALLVTRLRVAPSSGKRVLVSDGASDKDLMSTLNESCGRKVICSEIP